MIGSLCGLTKDCLRLSEASTPHPEPLTRNTKPFTINPNPETLQVRIAVPYAQGGAGYDVWQGGQKGVSIGLRIFALPSAIQVPSCEIPEPFLMREVPLYQNMLDLYVPRAGCFCFGWWHVRVVMTIVGHGTMRSMMQNVGLMLSSLQNT